MAYADTWIYDHEGSAGSVAVAGEIEGYRHYGQDRWLRHWIERGRDE